MNIAIILASGIGQRMKNETPKQFIIVKDKPIFLYSVLTFEDVDDIDYIFIVTSKDNIELVKKYVKEFNVTKVAGVIEGGSTRVESVRNGIKAIQDSGLAMHISKILIHDAARPLVSKEIIQANIDAFKGLKNSESLGVVTSIKATDTIVQSNDHEYVDRVLDRNSIYYNQTPQTFILYRMLPSYSDASNEATDDVTIMKNHGEKIKIVEGSPLNFKITTPHDLLIFKSIVENK